MFFAFKYINRCLCETLRTTYWQITTNLLCVMYMRRMHDGILNSQSLLIRDPLSRKFVRSHSKFK